MTINVRPANLNDVNAMAKVHHDSFHAAHRDYMPADFLAQLPIESFAERWQKRLTENTTPSFVAEVDQKIVGLICLTLTPEEMPSKCDPTSAEILFLYVEPTHSLQGVGRALCLMAADYIRQSGGKHIFGWAAINNPNSRAFYEAMGAITDGAERKVPRLNAEFHQILYQATL